MIPILVGVLAAREVGISETKDRHTGPSTSEFPGTPLPVSTL
jgi:hypothetical protein